MTRQGHRCRRVHEVGGDRNHRSLLREATHRSASHWLSVRPARACWVSLDHASVGRQAIRPCRRDLPEPLVPRPAAVDLHLPVAGCAWPDVTPSGRVRVDAIAPSLPPGHQARRQRRTPACRTRWPRVVTHGDRGRLGPGVPGAGRARDLVFRGAVAGPSGDDDRDPAWSRQRPSGSTSTWTRAARPACPEFAELCGDTAGRKVDASPRDEPPATAVVRPWTWRSTDFDVLAHVNNAAYAATAKRRSRPRRRRRHRSTAAGSSSSTAIRRCSGRPRRGRGAPTGDGFGLGGRRRPPGVHGPFDGDAAGAAPA